MRFVWLSENSAHVRRHVPTDLAEQVVQASGFLAMRQDDLTFTGTGTVKGKIYFAAYMTSGDEIYGGFRDSCGSDSSRRRAFLA